VKDIITVGDMYALAEGEGTQIIFIWFWLVWVDEPFE
jgi:hypothetical protein